MKNVLLIVATVLTISAVTVKGLTCLQCKGVSIPWICNKVVECYGGESCSIEQVLNEYGETVYNLGCLSNMVCSNFTSSINGQRVTCSECCNSKDLCNSKGCSQQGYPEQRGPICYKCPLHTDTAKCHDIEFCSVGEACNIVGKHIFSESVYKSSCISKHACKPEEGGHVAIIGKREIVMGKRSHEQHVCDSCCSEDVCNKNCTTAQIIIDPCLSSPCVHGTCKSEGSTFKCECPPGFRGSACQQDIDECSSSPCIHGTCVDRVNGYMCTCNQGYSGSNCQLDIDECSSSPCIHGTCVDRVNGYMCTCNQGYSGTNCQLDIDECSSSPCVHGTCVDRVNGYMCTCNQGYSGTNCQLDIDECSSSPCIHGTCVDLVNGYMCTCNQGYSGNNCLNDIDECLSNTCVNGNCTDLVNGYTCSCSRGYGGNNCQHINTDCADILRYGGNRGDGIYTIVTWKTNETIDVYCDMTTDGGGWTVFQYRFNGSVDFYRNFAQYEKGFGNLHSEFWLGLNYIEEIASQGQTDLRIDLEAADRAKAYETFDRFSLSPGPAFTLHLGSTIAKQNIKPPQDRKVCNFPAFMVVINPRYRKASLMQEGHPVSDSVSFGSYHNGSSFTTYDHDVDNYASNCAVSFSGAWWYDACYDANLNGKYLTPGTVDDKGMVYKAFIVSISLKSSKMMIRRRT